MAPSNWISLAFFAFLLLPGIYLDQLSQRHKEISDKSAITELGRIVLVSLVFSGIGFALIAVARIVCPTLLPDPGRLLNESNYWDTHYRKILYTLILEELIALYFVWLYDLATTLQRKSEYTPDDIWDIFLREDSSQHHGIFKKFSRKLLMQVLRIEKTQTQPPVPFEADETEQTSLTGEKSLLVNFQIEKRSFKLVKILLNSGEELVGFPRNWSTLSDQTGRELILDMVWKNNISRLPLELQHIAQRDVNVHQVFISENSIKSSSSYLLTHDFLIDHSTQQKGRLKMRVIMYAQKLRHNSLDRARKSIKEIVKR